MTKFTCTVCRKTFEVEGELPEVVGDEVLLCEGCATTVYRLTGIEAAESE